MGGGSWVIFIHGLGWLRCYLMCASLFIMLVSNGEQHINIVKIEDLARLMAGGDVFATHKKKDKRAGFLGGYCGNMWGRTGVNCSAKNLCRLWCRIAMCVVKK